MAKKHPRSAEIRQFILREVAEGSKDIPAITAEKFDLKIPAVNFHLRGLRAENVLEASGNTSGRTVFFGVGLTAHKFLPADRARSREDDPSRIRKIIPNVAGRVLFKLFESRDGGKGVVVPGCETCKKPANTVTQYMEHLADDALPVILRRAFAIAVQFGRSRLVWRDKTGKVAQGDG